MSQIVCKLSPEPKARVTNMRSEAFFIFSRGAYTIFLPGEAENTTFAIGRREQKYFRPARQKKINADNSWYLQLSEENRRKRKKKKLTAEKWDNRAELCLGSRSRKSLGSTASVHRCRHKLQLPPLLKLGCWLTSPGAPALVI